MGISSLCWPLSAAMLGTEFFALFTHSESCSGGRLGWSYPLGIAETGWPGSTSDGQPLERGLRNRLGRLPLSQDLRQSNLPPAPG